MLYYLNIINSCLIFLIIFIYYTYIIYIHILNQNVINYIIIVNNYSLILHLSTFHVLCFHLLFVLSCFTCILFYINQMR